MSFFEIQQIFVVGRTVLVSAEKCNHHFMILLHSALT